MKLEIIFFILYFLSAVFLVLSVVFLAKYKKFQAEEINKSADVYLFGLLFLFLYTFIMLLDSGKFIIKKIIPSFFHDYALYVNYLMLISNLSFILLMSICYLIAVLLLKETEA